MIITAFHTLNNDDIVVLTDKPNPCTEFPCKNSGTCMHIIDAVPSYKCICAENWGGLNCTEGTYVHFSHIGSFVVDLENILLGHDARPIDCLLGPKAVNVNDVRSRAYGTKNWRLNLAAAGIEFKPGHRYLEPFSGVCVLWSIMVPEISACKLIRNVRLPYLRQCETHRLLYSIHRYRNI